MFPISTILQLDLDGPMMAQRVVLFFQISHLGSQWGDHLRFELAPQPVFEEAGTGKTQIDAVRSELMNPTEGKQWLGDVSARPRDPRHSAAGRRKIVGAIENAAGRERGRRLAFDAVADLGRPEERSGGRGATVRVVLARCHVVCWIGVFGNRGMDGIEVWVETAVKVVSIY